MIVWDRATLSFHSETHSASDVTAALGMEPTSTHERGDARTNRSGGPSKLGGCYPTTHWSYDVHVPSGVDSRASSLRGFMQVFRGKSAAIDVLREGWDVRLWWSGSSDSSQGGFVFDSELLRDLAALGCDFFGTVYTSDADE